MQYASVVPFLTLPSSVPICAGATLGFALISPRTSGLFAPFLAIINNAAMKVHARDLCGHRFSLLLGRYCSGIAVLYVYV